MGADRFVIDPGETSLLGIETVGELRSPTFVGLGRHAPFAPDVIRVPDPFPFAFNIRDWNVIMSDSLHLPPSMHVFLVAEGINVINLLPRPFESVQGVERIPSSTRTPRSGPVPPLTQRPRRPPVGRPGVARSPSGPHAPCRPPIILLGSGRHRAQEALAPGNPTLYGKYSHD